MAPVHRAASERRQGRASLPLAVPRAWLVALALASSALLPADGRTLVALVAIILLGVPHGALDGELGRDLLHRRLGRAWFPVFALPYLLLSGAVLLAWRVAPLPTLAAFLAASVWHFGSEEIEGASALETLVRGGLPVAVPTLAHPQATALVFATVTGRTMEQPPAWMSIGAAVWLALAALWCARLATARRWPDLRAPGLLVACFLLLPPLTAFAIYFVCVHAPAHTRALIRDGARARRVHDARSAVLRAVPLTVATLLLGAMLWPFYGGPVAGRLLALTLQGLAALTLPHMLLERGFERLNAQVSSTRSS